MTSENQEKSEVELRYSIPVRDVFRREQPAALEGPPENWAVARATIDFAGALLSEHKHMRGERMLRDFVLTAILRRALITAEGIWWCLHQGLEESAHVLFRTLLDIELNIRLVTGDPTDRMAKRFAAYHYLGGQRQGEKLLRNRDVRKRLVEYYGDTSHTMEVVRSYARYLEEPVFDEVREEVRASRYWHGFASVEAAFEAAGEGSAYQTLYNGATPFVHDANVDHDFAEIVEGQVFVKAVVQRDPKVVQLHLGSMTTRLLAVLSSYIEDRGLPDLFQAHANDQGGEIEVDSFTGLTHLIVEHFGSDDIAAGPRKVDFS
jgi:hypothetical protein